MTRIKRKMTPLLRLQIKTQELRIKKCGDNAFFSSLIDLDEGSMYSKRKTRT